MNVNYVTAVRYTGRLSASYATPRLIKCDDDESYVVKFPPLGDERSSYNEYLGAALANYFNLPILDITVVLLTPEFVEEERGNLGDNVVCGYYFATPMQKDAMDATLENTRDMSTGTLGNQGDVPRMIVFDVFIGNCDRHPGNLLIIRDQATSKNNYVLIDHGHAFGGPKWNFENNSALPYRITKIPWKLDRITMAQFHSAAAEMCMIAMSTIDTLLVNIPRSWKIDKYDAAVRYALTHRIQECIIAAINENDAIWNAIQFDGAGS